MHDGSDDLAADQAAYRVFRPGGDPRILLVCDHASNRLPARYGTLGLCETDCMRHIAWDIGAAALTEALANLLDAPAVLANFSRLLIDPNRGLDDPTLMVALSDGTVIPGNRNLSAAERALRVASYYAPYHRAIQEALDRALSRRLSPAVLSIHSFTERWRGSARPWHVGILWNRDPRLAVPLIGLLRASGGLVVGDNEPYSGALEGDTMDRHGTARNLPHALIEIRQDLIIHPAGPKDVAAKLAPIIRQALSEAAAAGEVSL